MSRAVAALLAGSTDGQRDRLLDALEELCASRSDVSSGTIDLSRAVGGRAWAQVTDGSGMGYRRGLNSERRRLGGAGDALAR
ncbi:hypothetical protein [Acrocarpospora pleiomorpha]|uniref:hypothetical protein n=1 Tax=Acrocarpospora pleiomorpha TaxID=90975 RepID=UPI0031D0DDFA